MTVVKEHPESEPQNKEKETKEIKFFAKQNQGAFGAVQFLLILKVLPCFVDNAPSLQVVRLFVLAKFKTFDS